MDDQALSRAQVREVQQIAELETRRYFDHYLTEVFPRQQRAFREHTQSLIRQHDDSENAHGGVEQKFSRAVWLLIGVAVAGGAGGAGLTKLLLTVAA